MDNINIFITLPHKHKVLFNKRGRQSSNGDHVWIKKNPKLDELKKKYQTTISTIEHEDIHLGMVSNDLLCSSLLKYGEGKVPFFSFFQSDLINFDHPVISYKFTSKNGEEIKDNTSAHLLAPIDFENKDDFGDMDHWSAFFSQFLRMHCGRSFPREMDETSSMSVYHRETEFMHVYDSVTTFKNKSVVIGVDHYTYDTTVRVTRTVEKKLMDETIAFVQILADIVVSLSKN